MRRKTAPEIISVPTEALEGIKARMSTNELLEEDKKIVLAILGSYSWLMRQLESASFTIHRLKKMFGFSTEKHKKVSKDTAAADFSSEGTSAGEVLSLDKLQGIDKAIPEKK